MSRTIIIGDIHGCIDELGALLDAVGASNDDWLVSVGDLVAKGPDSQAVVQRARELGMQAVRGNHDARCLQWWRAVAAGAPPPRLQRTHMRVCKRLDPQDWAWLESLPYFLRFDDLGTIVVHGGLVPGVPLERQQPGHMLTIRSIREDGSVSREVHDGVPWGSRWPGPEEVVYGHDAFRGLQRHPHATGLDTGCVYGGRLTAYVLPERRLVSVAAYRVWSQVGGNGR